MKDKFTENCCLEDLENVQQDREIIDEEIQKKSKSGDGGWDDIEGL